MVEYFWQQFASLGKQYFKEFSAVINFIALTEIAGLYFFDQIVDWQQQISTILVRCFKVLLHPLLATLTFMSVSPLMEVRPFVIKSSLFSWIAVIVAGDFLYYVFHRLSHSVRFFWAQHYIHHTFTQMCLSNGMRNQVFNVLWALPTQLILVLMGFSWQMILSQFFVSACFQFSSHYHKQIKFPFYLDRIFVSPAFHYIHHQVATGGKNFGAIFVFWDHLFGTFSADKRDPRLGISYHSNPQNILTIIFHENVSIIKDFFKARGFRSKIDAFIKMKPFEESPEEIFSGKESA